MADDKTFVMYYVERLWSGSAKKPEPLVVEKVTDRMVVYREYSKMGAKTPEGKSYLIKKMRRAALGHGVFASYEGAVNYLRSTIASDIRKCKEEMDRLNAALEKADGHLKEQPDPPFYGVDGKEEN